MECADSMHASRHKSKRLYSIDPPSPVTSTSSDLDSDSSAPLSVYMCSINFDHKTSPYSQPLLPRAPDVRRAQKRPTRTSKMQQHSDDHVILEKRVVRALLLYARETRERLHECEEKLQSMENAMSSFQKSHEQQMIVLVKSLIAVQRNLADKEADKKLRTSGIVENEPEVHNVVPSSNSPLQLQPNDVNVQTTPTASDKMRLDFNHNITELSVTNGKPLYAVVNKKRVSKPLEPEVTRFAVFNPPPPPPLEDDMFLEPSARTPSLDLSLGGESGSFDDIPNFNQSHDDYSEVSSLNDFSVVSSPQRQENQRLESSSSMRDKNKFRPLPNRPENADPTKSSNLTRHLSYNDFPAIDKDERYGSGRYEEIKEKGHPTDFPPTPPLPTKTGQLLNRFKKKLKDTKRTLVKVATKDPFELEPPPWNRDRVDVNLEAGSISLISYKVDADEPFSDNKKRSELNSTGDIVSQFSSDETFNPHIYELSNSPCNTRTRTSHTRPTIPVPPTPANSNRNNKRFPSSSHISRTPTHRAALAESSPKKSRDSTLRRSISVDAILEHATSAASDESASQAEISLESLEIEDSLNGSLVDFGYLLDDVTQQQFEIEQLQKGATLAGGEPPPKPSRPGFPHVRSYPVQTGGPIYQPTTSQPSMYPPIGGRAPGIPPKNIRIMTPEELANHEAQANLQRRQLEEREIERRLALQKLEAQENDAWIKNQELKPDLPPHDVPFDPHDHLYQTADDMKKSKGSHPPPKPSRTHNKEPTQEAPSKAKFEEVKPTPTMKLDRDGDNVYRDTMNVVKSVLRTNQRVMEASPDNIFNFVKDIGKALKELCTSLTQEMMSVPEQFHREIDMAQKTTNKDLSQIINQMKLVRKFFNTTQVDDYKKCLMAANQVLAMDAKNLLDVVDKARFYKLESQGTATPPETEVSADVASTSAGPSSTPPPVSDE